MAQSSKEEESQTKSQSFLLPDLAEIESAFDFKRLTADQLDVLHSHSARGGYDSLLLEAARLGYVKIIKYCLGDDLKFFHSPASVGEALVVAASANQAEAVKLLEFGSRVDDESCNRAFRAAAAQGLVEVMKISLRDPRLNPYDADTALDYAVIRNRLEIVRILLSDSRCHYKIYRDRVLLLATRYRRDKILNMILYDPGMQDGWAS